MCCASQLGGCFHKPYVASHDKFLGHSCYILGFQVTMILIALSVVLGLLWATDITHRRLFKESCPPIEFFVK